MDDMKKTLVVSLGALLLLSSCGTYAGSGAVTGGSFGSIIGSAVGGISGGWRGSHVGSLIGMAGGAVVGAAIGSAADRAEQQRYEEYAERRQRRYEDYGRTRGSEHRTPQYGRNNEQRGYDYQGDYNNDQSGFDSSNKGDDRLYGFDENFNAKPDSVSVTALSLPAIEIRNAHVIDATHDGALSRGEEVRMVFEVYNNSPKPIFQIQPTVSEVTGNKHIRVSENVLVESIMPGRGIRYTAVIKADDRLKDGEAIIRISVLHNNKEVASQSKEFPIQTFK
jgi:hypothetical protein